MVTYTHNVCMQRSSVVELTIMLDGLAIVFHKWGERVLTPRRNYFTSVTHEMVTCCQRPLIHVMERR
jgi:hypothetical protein